MTHQHSLKKLSINLAEFKVFKVNEAFVLDFGGYLLKTLKVAFSSWAGSKALLTPFLKNCLVVKTIQKHHMWLAPSKHDHAGLCHRDKTVKFMLVSASILEHK
jgi:hypothetical protein